MKTLLKAAAVGTAVLVLGTGTAWSANGGTFVLGRANDASTQTLLRSSGAGPVLALSTKPGQSPLATSFRSGKATNLNVDMLDGLDSTLFQRRVTGGCQGGAALVTVGALGQPVCQGTAYDFADAELTTDTTGVAAIQCPGTGGVSTSGGYTLPPGTAAFANGSTLFGDADGEGYNVRIAKVDGTPYVGPIELTVQCEYPGTTPTSGSTLRKAGDAKARAALR